MNKNFVTKISEYKDRNGDLHKLMVSLYVLKNNIIVKRNKLIKENLISDTDSLYLDLVKLQNLNKDEDFDLNDLIQIFEVLIPKRESTINGAVYTPTNIKNYLVDSSFKKISKPANRVTCADISCGCGGFLLTIAKYINEKTAKSIKEIYKENIFGSDISELSIKRTKLLLSLYAIQNGEDEIEFDFNLHIGNTLDFNKVELDKKYSLIKDGFDIVVGNPPYVRAKNIDLGSKSLLSKWETTGTGNPDLYIPFFEIGMKMLNMDGVLGYITVNSFYKSVNARSLRKYFYDHKFELEIIDFGSEKIFGKRSAYTCICFIRNKPGKINFLREPSKNLGVVDKRFNPIDYEVVDYQKGWLLSDESIVENILKIEKCGQSLGSKYKIKNGIATLGNHIYIFHPKSETDKYYICDYKGKEFEIEKGICKDIIKPNVLKNEKDIEGVKEKLIYPYKNSIAPLQLFDELEFQTNYPKAFKYLTYFKDVLSNRDKGKKEYEKWYAFGRNQALTDKGYKLLFPYIAKEPIFVLCKDENMLLYCGYAIFCDNIDELKLLKKILLSKVFWYYIKNTSKPYSGSFFSLAKNYVKNFGVCNLTEEESDFISKTEDTNAIDRMLINKYKLDISEL